MDDNEILRNELIFRGSLLDAEIPKERIEAAMASLMPPPASQVERHARLYELLNYADIIKVKHLENTTAARTFQTVMEIYVQAIPNMVPSEKWN